MAPASAYAALVFFAAATVLPARALDDGLARTPPMGWRSWNTFGGNVDQSLMLDMMKRVTQRDRIADGVPTSLCDLGYCEVGLDDGWQLCGRYGPRKYTFHNLEGAPVVNRSRFPDLEALTITAHGLGLTAGFYLNNCICADHCAGEECYRGDVAALSLFGFDGAKLDGCSAQWNLSKWQSLIQASGRKVVIENCHWGRTLPTATWCPFHFYRTSADIRPNYASVVGNLQTVLPLAEKNLSRPGCWAYPDMLEVGVGGAGDGGAVAEVERSPAPAHSSGGVRGSLALLSGLSLAETRAHFGGWCIVSAPLILGHDLRNKAIAERVWPIISNREAIGVNQAYFGHSGSVFAEARELVYLGDMADDTPVHVPVWQQLYKPLAADGSRAAILVMNHGPAATTIEVRFAQVPGMSPGAGRCTVRDLWARRDLGDFDGTFTITGLPSHDTAFLRVSCQSLEARPLAE